ncbi:hypothetical protein AB685_14285 [Bacillus sp. LL01]|uniref:hypothetical protein n=1 Tax=Bacillus sp. LL01 TaxID=1665556 RepID=UPI00064D5B75|nr:hypothetical protein [Bacillus sp. LL01]KMJ57991.1 hypothetical protein AB685_14285 [Bacillus sp. LL01]
MKKLLCWTLITVLLCSGSIIAAPTVLASHDQHHSHHKEWSKEDKDKFKQLEKDGYKKHDIFHAMHLAKLANKDVEEILKYYKQSQSWEATAEHFNVEADLLKKHHHRHSKRYNEYLEQNKDKIVPYLSTYLNKDQADLEKYLNEGTKMHTLVKASILSKLADVDIADILAKKENGQSFKEIAEELNVDKEEIFTEIKKLKETIKPQ